MARAITVIDVEVERLGADKIEISFNNDDYRIILSEADWVSFRECVDVDVEWRCIGRDGAVRKAGSAKICNNNITVWIGGAFNDTVLVMTPGMTSVMKEIVHTVLSQSGRFARYGRQA